MSEYLVGIDIGSSKVYAAVAKVDKNKENLLISGISSAKCDGLSKGIVIDIEETSLSIQKCIGQLEDLIGESIETVNLVIPQKLYEFYENKGVVAITSGDRKIREEDIKRVESAVRNITVQPGKEVIGIIYKEFTIDDKTKVKNPIGYVGDKLELDAQVIVGRVTSLNNLFNSVKKAGILVEGIDVQSESVAKAVLKKDERKNGVAIIDVGEQTIDISVYKNDYLWYTKNIPLGGKNITNDISIGLKLAYNKAEELKMNYGTLVYEEDEVIISSSNYIENDITLSNLVEIIDARIDEFLGFIKDDLEINHILEEIECAVIVGGGITQFKGIIEKCEKALDRPVRIGVPNYIGGASTMFANVIGVLVNIFETMPKEEGQGLEEELFDFSKEEKEEKEKNISLADKIKNFFADLF